MNLQSLFLCQLICACLNLTAALADQPPLPKRLVSVTIAPQRFLVNALAQESVEVSVMLPPGVNHETFEPSMNQLKELSRAEMYIQLGHPKFTFETAWLDKILASRSNLKIVNSSLGATLVLDDIHFWLSPANMDIMLNNTAKALIELFPQQREVIEARTQTLHARIEALQSNLRNKFSSCNSRSFLVFHPAWTYFSKEFQLEQLAIEQEGKEPGIFQLQNLIKEAQKRKLKILYKEPSSPVDVSQMIARELGGEVEILDPLAENWLENLNSFADSLVRHCGRQDPALSTQEESKR